MERLSPCHFERSEKTWHRPISPMPPHVAVRHRFLTQREVRLIRRFLGEP
ncbi:MAG: DUF4248 domain-containing protein [Phocaeicola plebeius]|nr:DUF4248 domain-containing protein [Phocaeicola plebeius]